MSEDRDQEPDEPGEGDWTTDDHTYFYEVGSIRRKPVAIVPRDSSTREMWRALNAEMHRIGFFPNVWFISDHGNAHLMTPDDRPDTFGAPKRAPKVDRVREKVRQHVGAQPGKPLPAFAWPGGYPISYLTKRGEDLCAKCAETDTDADDPVVAGDVYWEGAPLYCAGCNTVIESAYGDPEEK